MTSPSKNHPPTLAELVNFNRGQRDAWVASVARRLPPGTRILDIGAGPCRYRPLFAHCAYQAQDFAQYDGSNAGSPDHDWHYGELDYVCDASAIPAPDASFDAILCTEVLEHVPDPVRVLGEISRLLRPGGQAFLSAPLGSGLHQQPYHFYGGFTPYFYQRFLAQNGLALVKIEANGHYFRWMLQEIHRAVGILQKAYHYPRWHPMRWVFRIFTNYRVAVWLSELDDRLPVEAFSVGYHVEAVKKSGS